jgi:outer membrane protein
MGAKNLCFEKLICHPEQRERSALRRFRASKSKGSLVVLFLFFAAVFSSVAASHAETLTLRHAIELALTHGTTTAIASADQRKVDAAFREARNNYLPQFVIGSALGKSFGFPLSLEGAAPSIINLNTQAALFNPALQQYMKAARVESHAAELTGKDRRAQVIQETVVNYLELAQWEKQTEQLQKDAADSQKTESAVEERIREGVDKELERAKAKLVTARIRLRLAQAQGSADVLRLKLSQFTGVPAQSITTASDSIPALPPSAPDSYTSAEASNNFAVAGAEEHARAQYLRAKAEHRVLWPSVDFAGQYSRLARFNNYDEFFKRYEANNGSIGAVMRFPIFNFSQRAHAEGADADALKARKEAEAAKDQVSAELLQLQRTVQQLSAARDVAELEYQIARSQLEAVEIRVQSSGATFHDLEDARTQVRERRDQFLDADLQYTRARVGLLRLGGGLEAWALGGR